MTRIGSPFLGLCGSFTLPQEMGIGFHAVTAFQIQGKKPKAIKLKHSSRIIATAGHRGDKQVVIDALAADDPVEREAALGAARRLKLLDYNMLTSFLDDPSTRVRRRALELAPRLGGPRSEDDGPPPQSEIDLAVAVMDLLDDEDCAEVAAFALGEMGIATTPVVTALEQQAAYHGDPLCRESAVAALGALGAGRVAVLSAARDVATVRRRAVIALANFEGQDVDEALERALSDRDWQVRQAAEDLLGIAASAANDDEE